MRTPTLTIQKFNTLELLHCIPLSDVIMARALLKNFDFILVSDHENEREPVNSFWINIQSRLTALVWNDHPLSYKANN